MILDKQGKEKFEEMNKKQRKIVKASKKAQKKSRERMALACPLYTPIGRVRTTSTFSKESITTREANRIIKKQETKFIMDNEGNRTLVAARDRKEPELLNEWKKSKFGVLVKRNYKKVYSIS